MANIFSTAQVRWYSIDPRTHSTVFYSEADSASIEAAYKARQPGFCLNISGLPFRLDFATMRQYNKAGGSRVIGRQDGVPGAPVGSSSGISAHESFFPTDLLAADFHMSATESLDRADAMIDNIQPHLKNKDSLKKAMSDISSCLNNDHLFSLFDHLIAFAINPLVNDKAQEMLLDPLLAQRLSRLSHYPPGCPLPPYFANVVNESPLQRKLLSLLGLRNLLKDGPSIFCDLYDASFSSNPSDYAPEKGLNHMKRVTGNMVDLDTLIIDCKDFNSFNRDLDSANRSEKKKYRCNFDNAKDFFYSEEAKHLARQAAAPLIDFFKSAMGIDNSQAKKRRLDLGTKTTIPVANSHQDRGHSPVWGYSNAGVFTYHANVPILEDVVGSLLKAPVLLLRMFIFLIKRHLGGLAAQGVKGVPLFMPSSLDTPTSGRQKAAKDDKSLALIPFLQAVRDLIEHAVTDKCFNAKWHSILEYSRALFKSDTIPSVLAKFEEENKQVLTKVLIDLSDDDDDKGDEAYKKKFIELLKGTELKGLDNSNKEWRRINEEDVSLFLKQRF